MKKIPHLRLILAGLVVIGLIALVVFWQDEKGQTHYKFATLAQGSVSQTVSANGTLNPVTLVNVGTQVSGRVDHLYVDFNDEVKEGQVLARIDDSLLAPKLRQSEASLTSAQASLDLASANERRMKKLYDQEFVSRQEWDVSVEALKSARAQVTQAKAQRDQDKANLDKVVIISPVSGVVIDRQVDVGQTVASSFQTPTLFKIAQDLSKMQIDSAFAEADVGNIKEGQQVRFTVDAFPDQRFSGVVRQVRLNPTTTSNVVTYNVVVSVDNPDLILLPGMTAYVNIVVARQKDVLLVPNAALRYKPTVAASEKKASGGLMGMMPRMGPPRGGRSGNNGKAEAVAKGEVYIVHDGKLTPVELHLGITDGQNTEVLEGTLKAGDQVVIGELLPGETADSGGVSVRAF
ncbi:MAG: efflux RND transporter periplasmic adaptor subunit [Zoogloeaceae bacterium]|jgi:HlyD family secretion protein|nr:efflux RND transporter periplasmic adaptor subunit [Zoogloeaceae bacterium]